MHKNPFSGSTYRQANPRQQAIHNSNIRRFMFCLPKIDNHPQCISQKEIKMHNRHWLCILLFFSLVPADSVRQDATFLFTALDSSQCFSWCIVDWVYICWMNAWLIHVIPLILLPDCCELQRVTMPDFFSHNLIFCSHRLAISIAQSFNSKWLPITHGALPCLNHPPP